MHDPYGVVIDGLHFHRNRRIEVLRGGVVIRELDGEADVRRIDLVR